MEQEIKYLKKYLTKEDLENGMQKLKQGIAVQYIVGEVDFYGNRIKVNPNVLIPRFETEELLEKTISYAKTMFENKIDIVDLGTGSGCIAITLKKELNSRVDAVDISKEAILVAQENALFNQADICFYQGDMLQPLNQKYDLIISNPPYLSRDEEVMEVVAKNEPSIALYAKEEGLYYYHEILKHITSYVKEKYMIAFEIGEGQGITIKGFAEKYLKDIEVKIENDMQGRERFLFIFHQ